MGTKVKTAMVLVLAFAAFAQHLPAPPASPGECSLVAAGDSDAATFRCPITKEEGLQVLKIVNEVLSKRLDPEKVAARLAEMPGNMLQRRDDQGWPELTTGQLETISKAVSPFAGQEMQIVVPNPARDTDRFAEQLRQALMAEPAKWRASVHAEKTSVASTAPLPLGVELRVKELRPAAESLANSLVALFGPFGVHEITDPDMSDGRIEIRVLPKPFFAENPALRSLCRAKVIPQSGCPWSPDDESSSVLIPVK
jgi:hypothetical protein